MMKKDASRDEPAPFRAFAYARANTGSPQRNQDAIAEQLEGIDSFARRWGISIVSSFVKADVTVQYFGLAVIESMIEQATAAERPVDYVVVTSQCRLGRSRSELMEVDRQLLEIGGEVICVCNSAADVVPSD